MNIFYLDHKPALAAEMHCDKHVVKMLLESAQLLCGVHHILAPENAPKELYKLTHKNHPCAVWARTSGENYNWLANLAIFLSSEYTVRYDKRHKADNLINWLWWNKPSNFSHVGFTPPALAMPPQYQIPADPITSYRNYYWSEKRHFARWKLGNVPLWFTQREKELTQ